MSAAAVGERRSGMPPELAKLARTTRSSLFEKKAMGSRASLPVPTFKIAHEGA
jgi:hypothetical protein